MSCEEKTGKLFFRFFRYLGFGKLSRRPLNVLLCLASDGTGGLGTCWDNEEHCVTLVDKVMIDNATTTSWWRQGVVHHIHKLDVCAHTAHTHSELWLHWRSKGPLRNCLPRIFILLRPVKPNPTFPFFLERTLFGFYGCSNSGFLCLGVWDLCEQRFALWNPVNTRTVWSRDLERNHHRLKYLHLALKQHLDVEHPSESRGGACVAQHLCRLRAKTIPQKCEQRNAKPLKFMWPQKRNQQRGNEGMSPPAANSCSLWDDPLISSASLRVKAQTYLNCIKMGNHICIFPVSFALLLSMSL